MGIWFSGGSRSVIVGCMDKKVANTSSRREIDTHEPGALVSRFLYDLSGS